MKIGVLSDAHGNILGMKTCIDFFCHKKVKKIFFLGDAVGYFPDAVPVINLLQSVQATCLMGNHDAMLIGDLEIENTKEAVYQIKRSKQEISSKRLHQISKLLPYKQLEIEEKLILFVHGSPWNPLNGYVYPDTDLKRFFGLPFDIIFMGHTHMPFIHQSKGVTVVNVGSCGLPRDQGTLASCVLCDLESGQCEIVRIPLNIEAIQRKYENKIHPSVMDCFFR